MLRKNVYILYPAGYFGTYLNWAINISDRDLATSTVKNPINKESSDIRGGAGTSHMHVKIPSHQPFMNHVAWVMYNQPIEYKVYNINQGQNGEINNPISTERFISVILNSDPDCIFINIHNGLDKDIANFGNINAVTKWPTQMAIRQIFGTLGHNKELYKIDPFNCADDLNFRNLVVTTSKDLFRQQVPIDKDALQIMLEKDMQWYELRNRLQPHEVNEETYINPKTYVDNKAYLSRIFELSCLEIVTDSFPVVFSKFLKDFDICTDPDTTHLEHFHQEFINAQSNLQWFNSIRRWRETKELDDFLKSHMGIQGMVIHEMIKICPKIMRLDWQNKSIEELNNILTNHYNSV